MSYLAIVKIIKHPIIYGDLLVGRLQVLFLPLFLSHLMWLRGINRLGSESMERELDFSKCLLYFINLILQKRTKASLLLLWTIHGLEAVYVECGLEHLELQCWQDSTNFSLRGMSK